MTDVLIKNWCIPECCMDCDPDFAYAIKCKAYNENNDFTRQRAENCPLVEIKHSQDGDTISRADAIEAVRNICNTPCNEYFVKAIAALPSAESVPKRVRLADDVVAEIDEASYEIGYSHGQRAEAVQGWIPCSERLPRNGEEYFVTIVWTGSSGTKYTEIYTSWYAKDKWTDIPDIAKVTAWMPLPEPYEEASR